MVTSSLPLRVDLFVIFGKDADDSPLAIALRNLGIELTIFSDSIRLNYPRKVLRYLLGWPSLLWYSFRSVYRSLQQRPKADAAIVNSHFDILAFALLCVLLRKKPPKIVLPGFIYTEGLGTSAQRLKLAYYKWILAHTDSVICHSESEVQANEKRFRGLKTRFVYFPYAIHVVGATGYTDSTLTAKTIVSAGRSGRDYALLIHAVRDLPVSLHIICDMFPESLLAGLPENVHVLDSCYGDCYINELATCRFVVIPLSVTDISAGQMVLLQAMAMGKPAVITRTATTADYVEEGDGVLLVEPGNEKALSTAIERLAVDDDLCGMLGRRAAEIFTKKYSIEAYASHLAVAARMACDQ